MSSSDAFTPAWRLYNSMRYLDAPGMLQALQDGATHEGLVAGCRRLPSGPIGWIVAEAKSADVALACIELLIPALNAKKRYPEGDSPLMRAACQPGWEEVARALLPVSNALARDSKGQTALMLARKGGIEMVELLLPVSDPRAIRDDTGVTALMQCAANEKSSGDGGRMARALIAVSDLNQRDAQRRTALHWAVKHSDPGMTQLLAMGTDLLAPRGGGRRVIHELWNILATSTQDMDAGTRNGHGEVLQSALQAQELSQELPTPASARAPLRVL